MEGIKIKREAYIKRLSELMEKENTVTDTGELKKIKSQIRYVERKIYESNFPPRVKDYKVRVKLVFEGEVTVYTTSKEKALKIVNDDFDAALHDVQAFTPELINWDIPVKPKKIIR